MANITIRDLPNRTKETLRVKAAQSGLSLETYARHILQTAARYSAEKPSDIASTAAKYFGAQHGVDLELPERTTRRGVPDFQ